MLGVEIDDQYLARVLGQRARDVVQDNLQNLFLKRVIEIENSVLRWKDVVRGVAADDLDSLQYEPRELSLIFESWPKQRGRDRSRPLGVLVWRTNLGAAHKSCRELAVDADQRAKVLAPGIGHHRQGPVHYEQPQVGDVLADGDGQRVLRAGHRRQED